MGGWATRWETRAGSIDAIQAFRANPRKYDLVISDITMPKMTAMKSPDRTTNTPFEQCFELMARGEMQIGEVLKLCQSEMPEVGRSIFPISYEAARMMVMKAGKIVGIHLRPHDLRCRLSIKGRRPGLPAFLSELDRETMNAGLPSPETSKQIQMVVNWQARK